MIVMYKWSLGGTLSNNLEVCISWSPVDNFFLCPWLDWHSRGIRKRGAESEAKAVPKSSKVFKPPVPFPGAAWTLTVVGVLLAEWTISTLMLQTFLQSIRRGEGSWVEEAGCRWSKAVGAPWRHPRGSSKHESHLEEWALRGPWRLCQAWCKLRGLCQEIPGSLVFCRLKGMGCCSCCFPHAYLMAAVRCQCLICAVYTHIHADIPKIKFLKALEKVLFSYL